MTDLVCPRCGATGDTIRGHTTRSRDGGASVHGVTCDGCGKMGHPTEWSR